MVYVDPKYLGYRPFWDRWIQENESKLLQEDLDRLFERYVPSCITYIIEGIIDSKQVEKLKNIIPLTDLNLVS